MKKIVVFLVIIGLLFVGYAKVPAFAEQVNNVIYTNPCASPKTFSIGTIDSRFNLSKDALIQDAQEAGSIWKNDQGMALLKYDPNSKLTINMVYDQRQSLDTQINSLNSQVTQQKQNLKPAISDYEKKVAAFKQKSADLNSQIEYWNNKGGAPQDEYDKLNAQQRELQQEEMQLRQMANALNQSTDQYNNQIQQLDQKVNNFNQALQYKPEEGLYIRNGNEESIEIYFDNSHQELIHTLAHEMGHALGMQHNNNPQSIMYPQTTTAETPSNDDLAALEQACQKRSIFQTLATNFSALVQQGSQNLSSVLNHN
ncbi:MAG: matrixin family metalloprotease [Candidatus Levyibacteriota bacterium]